MKKSILVILLVLLAFTVWSVLVFGKAKQEEPTKQPTQIQKTELSPGPEAFPAVVLPKAKPTKPTVEDFQKLMLEKKGITPEMLEQRKLENVPAEDFEALEKEPLTFCTIGNQVLPCCYRSTPDNLYLRCWGEVGTATYMDPDNNGYGMVVCPYPIYPFNATKVAMALNTTDTCTVVFRPEIWSVVYIDHSPYPYEPIWIGPEYTFKPAGGTNSTYLSLGADVCLYEPWFAVVTYMNTDDRYDPDYCPDGNTIPAYQSWIFDIAGRLEQSYWSPYGGYYGWFDVVENGICSGAIRVRTQGYNRPENACPILPDDYYYKVGMTDFTQYYPGVPGPAYCGPVAGANSIWWFGCVDSQFTPSWGGCDPGMEIALIQEIAAAAGTDPILGTNCDSLEAALIQVVKAHGGWNFIETTVYAPTFWYLQYQLRVCEDVVLLLGFWQEDPPGVWNRFGGHFVTLAGVDYVNYAFAFSDPATPEGYNNYFVAWPSASPGGIVWIPDYYLPWPDFQGQNAGPLPNTGPYNPILPVYVEVEQAIVISPGLKEMSGEVTGSLCYEILNNHGGIDAFGVDFGAGIVDGLYKGSLVVGTEQADLNCDYGDYYPTMTFDPLGPPTNNTFTRYETGPGETDTMTFNQLTNHFAHRFIDGLEIYNYAFGFWVSEGVNDEAEYMIEEVKILVNNTATPIDVEIAKWKDIDKSAGGVGDLSDFNQLYQSIWMYDVAVPNEVFGLIEVPHVIGDIPHTGYAFSQAVRVYDGQYMDSLFYWMENIGWGGDNPGVPEDKSIIVSEKITVPANGIAIKIWNDWGYPDVIAVGGDANWRIFTYRLLHFLGYYRGDVNKDGKLTVTDVIYTINYLFKGGVKPVDFVDQGDLNNDTKTNVTDVIYLINYLFKGGPAPIDSYRPVMYSPFVNPAHQALGTRTPGLFGDPNWRTLHP